MARDLAPPRDLTIPSPGSHTARDVLSRAVGRLMAELPRLLAASPAPEADRRAVLGAWQRTVLRTPGAAASVARGPVVGALARCLRPGRLADAARARAAEELAAAIAVELAAAGALDEPLRLSSVPRAIRLPALDVTIVPPADATAIDVEPGWVRFERPGGAVAVAVGPAEVVAEPPARIERSYVAIERAHRLALDDANPVALEEAHPDKSGNAVDLGGRDATTWATALRDALSPIATHMPDLRAEMDLFVQLVVPVGWDAEKHLSASYREAIGTVYLSLHPHTMTLAEALVHEHSHNKLNALFELDPVLEGGGALVKSPVRPDARPLEGVLLAVHAFLPIARLYEAMIEARDPFADSPTFAARFDAVRRTNREGAETLLAHARPTPIGASILDEIRRWIDHFG